MKRLVSVVIPTYNRGFFIDKTLKSLLEQSYENYEIIVVNDGSTDNTEEIIKKFKVRYVKQENKGPAAARNNGVRHAKGSVIAFIDSDCIADRNWLRELSNGFASNIAIVGGTTIEINRKSISDLWMIDKQKHYFASNNLAIKKEIFEDVQGFHPIFKRPGAEDIDLCFKVQKKGYKLGFVDNARIYHYHTRNLKEWLKQNYYYGIGDAKFMLLHDRQKIFQPFYFFLIPIITIKLALKQTRLSKKSGIFPIFIFLAFFLLISNHLGKTIYLLKKKKFRLLFFNASHLV